MKQIGLLCMGLIGLLTALAGPMAAAREFPVRMSPDSAPIRLLDALGRQVTLPRPSQRIVITGKAMVAVADAIYTFPSAPARIVALGTSTQRRDSFIAVIDPAFASKAVIELQASAEEIAALRPDLVILKCGLAETVGKALETIGIPLVYVDFETPEHYQRDIAILGAVLGDATRAGEVSAYFESRVRAVQVAIAGVEARPTVLLLYYRDRDGGIAFNVPPSSWIQTRLVTMAGGRPVWEDANPGQGWMQVNLEQVAAWDADHIFITSYTRSASDIVAALKKDQRWQSLRAVRTGRLHAFASDFYSWDQPDTRWILGLAWLAGRLHCERFPDLNMVREAQQFYQTLYGLDEAFFDERIRPALSGELQ